MAESFWAGGYGKQDIGERGVGLPNIHKFDI
jgi:hypothetical protein